MNLAYSFEDRVVAIVNDQVILESELREKLETVNLENLNRIQLAKVRNDLLDQLVTESLMDQATARMGIRVSDIDLQNQIKNFEIIVNATSLGLKDGEDFNFNFEEHEKNLIYIDTIYNPLETKTLKFLSEREIRVFNGLDMFIYQGQKSFYLWNKINPEIDNELVELLNSKLK